AGARDPGPQRSFAGGSREGTNRTVGQGRTEVGGEDAAHFRQGPVGRVRDVLRLGPGHRLTGLDDEDGVSAAPGKDLVEPFAPAGLEGGPLSDKDLVVRRVRLVRRVTPEGGVHLRHPRQEAVIVGADPATRSWLPTAWWCWQSRLSLAGRPPIRGIEATLSRGLRAPALPRAPAAVGNPEQHRG